jgi:hypothetical protein
MAPTEQQIQVKNHALDWRRQSMRQHGHALRADALRYCARPSTLGAAALSGFLLARILPPLTRSSNKPLQSGQPAKLLEQLVQLIPVIVVERIRYALLRRQHTRNYRENTEEKHSCSGLQ